MTQLINADELRELYNEHIFDTYNDYSFAIDTLDYIPTVDAVPVRHAHWIFNPKDAIEMMFTLPKCSECGAESADNGNYCSNCGARMDKE